MRNNMFAEELAGRAAGKAEVLPAVQMRIVEANFAGSPLAVPTRLPPTGRCQEELPAAE